MKIEYRLKYRDKISGKISISGTMELRHAIQCRDSGLYQEAVIVRDEPGWPAWEEWNLEDR